MTHTFRTLALGLSTAAMMALAGPVQALSCLMPDPVATFLQAAESSDSSAVLYGDFDFDPSGMPSFDGRTEPENVPPIPARFDGAALTSGGFTLPYETELWLQPTCAGPWCGGMHPADNVLAFVRDRGDGTYELELGACPFWAYFDPSREVLSQMTACMNGAASCVPEDRIGR